MVQQHDYDVQLTCMMSTEAHRLLHGGEKRVTGGMRGIRDVDKRLENRELDSW